MATADIWRVPILPTIMLSTRLTTFVMVFVIYLLGVASIKEFALPIIVGIVCGVYSSVFVTGSLWYVMAKKKFQKK